MILEQSGEHSRAFMQTFGRIARMFESIARAVGRIRASIQVHSAKHYGASRVNSGASCESSGAIWRAFMRILVRIRPHRGNFRAHSAVRSGLAFCAFGRIPMTIRANRASLRIRVDMGAHSGGYSGAWRGRSDAPRGRSGAVR